jgi:hypothetical protein
MLLWLLTRPDPVPNESFSNVYDCCNRMVVAADNETEAREIAARNCHREGRGVWLGEAMCEMIGVADKRFRAKVIIQDVLEG